MKSFQMQFKKTAPMDWCFACTRRSPITRLVAYNASCVGSERAMSLFTQHLFSNHRVKNLFLKQMGNEQQRPACSSKFRIADKRKSKRRSRGARGRFRVYLTPSKIQKKKWRISWTDSKGKEKHVDFGAAGMSDFTKHKDPRRMARYVGRHLGKGGFRKLPKRARDLAQKDKLSKSQKEELIKIMIKVKSSPKENWKKSGMDHAGFWSRWLTWSYPTLTKAKQFIKKKFGISIIDGKKSKKKSKKPKKKKSKKPKKRRSRKTGKQLRAGCKRRGLVYNPTTKRCRKRKSSRGRRRFKMLSLKQIAAKAVPGDVYAGLQVTEQPTGNLHPVAEQLATQIREARPQVSVTKTNLMKTQAKMLGVDPNVAKIIKKGKKTKKLSANVLRKHMSKARKVKKLQRSLAESQIKIRDGPPRFHLLGDVIDDSLCDSLEAMVRIARLRRDEHWLSIVFPPSIQDDLGLPSMTERIKSFFKRKVGSGYTPWSIIEDFLHLERKNNPIPFVEDSDEECDCQECRRLREVRRRESRSSGGSRKLERELDLSVPINRAIDTVDKLCFRTAGSGPYKAGGWTRHYERAMDNDVFADAVKELYSKMVAYEINNNPDIQIGDWVWVHPDLPDVSPRRPHSSPVDIMGAYAGLGRVSVKPTTFEEYSKIKLGERNAKTLKRLGIKPLIKTIISRARMVEDGVHNPASKFPDFIKEALMAKGNSIMIRSIDWSEWLYPVMEPRSPLWRQRRGLWGALSENVTEEALDNWWEANRD